MLGGWQARKKVGWKDVRLGGWQSGRKDGIFLFFKRFL